MNLFLVFVASTAGAYLGALLLYWLGARPGLERSIRWLSKLGTQYRLIGEYSRFLNYAVYAAPAVAVVLLIIRRTKRAKARRSPHERADSRR